MSAGVDRKRLAELTRAERETFAERHPRSRELYERAQGSLLGGVPMSWMMMWAGGHPLFFERAAAARITDVDGNELVDLCLGDTGAMAGHAPEPTAAAVARRAASGITTMLPSEDAIAAGEELSRRFGLDRWQLTLSATDANRFAIRIARRLTGRPKILVFNYCYHGTVDEIYATLRPNGSVGPREGNVGPPVDPAVTTRVVEFNDVEALRRELAHGDVACVLAEPALTNIGIVLPDDGFHHALREATREAGTLLIVDETHTLSAGPAGCTGAWGLEPDMLTIGKSIAGGVPAGAFGMDAVTGARVIGDEEADIVDTGGVGGTLAGNALSAAAMRATLEHVLTDEAFERMLTLGERLRRGIEQGIAETGLPWHVVGLGARAEYRFSPSPPRNGGEAARIGDPELEEFMHLYALNRGVLITPFHSMALVSPATMAADVDRHSEVFAAACAALRGD
jgi:glutamate-1-semialdehyde 2,1-aminomutase